MQIHILTIHPYMVEAYAKVGVLHAASEKNLAQISAVDLRQYAVDKHGSVDARPYGGGDGMVMRPEPLADALKSIAPKPYTVLLSPAGKTFSQKDAERLLALGRPLALVCGRFGGVDQRFIDHYVDEECSLGDFILAGGELGALAIAEACLRLLPGVLGHAQSAANDSFSPGMNGLLEHPLYTKPPVFEGESVPEVLMSGDHAKIAQWRKAQSLALTKKKRLDLLRPQ